MKSFLLRALLTLLGAALGLVGGVFLSAFLAAHWAPSNDDVPPFAGILFGGFFGLALGALLAQIPYARRRDSGKGE